MLFYYNEKYQLIDKNAYACKWDSEKKIYLDHPVHDWSSHCADAWRTVGLTWRPAKLKAPEPVDQPMVAKPWVWKDLRERLRDAQRERDDLKRQLRMMDEFRARAMWVCPLMDANASADERRAHLQSHLNRLPPKRKP